MSRCNNPLCSCDPCGCGTVCKCGAAKLGDLERQVMERVWQAGDADVTVRQVATALPGYAYTTVATVLDRLVGKGVLRCHVTRRVKHYGAIGTSGSHTAVLMYEALSSDSHPDDALRRFAGTLTDDEAAVLRGALDTARTGPRVETRR